MNFIDAIRTCFSKYVGFSGRARRAEFWFFFLFQLLMGIAAAVLDRGFVEGGQKLFTALVSLVLFLPGLAVTVRRLHDVNHRGWWLLLPLPFIVFGAVIIPVATLKAVPLFVIIGALLGVAGLGLAILLLVWYCTRGTVGPNRFGPNPLANA